MVVLGVVVGGDGVEVVKGTSRLSSSGCSNLLVLTIFNVLSVVRVLSTSVLFFSVAVITSEDMFIFVKLLISKALSISLDDNNEETDGMSGKRALMLGITEDGLLCAFFAGNG